MSRTRRIVLAGLRVIIGAVFIAQGAPKLLHHAKTLADFTHWGAPAPGPAVYAIGFLELVGGLALATGLVTRLASLLLLLDMLGTIATAGRVDGGRYLVVPAIVGLACLVLVARGGGGWQLLDRIDPPRRPPRRA